MLECWLTWTCACLVQTLTASMSAEIQLSPQDTIVLQSSLCSGSKSFPTPSWTVLCETLEKIYNMVVSRCTISDWVHHWLLFSLLWPVLKFVYEPPSFVQRNFSENVYVLIFNLDSEGLNSSHYTCIISAKTSSLDFFSIFSYINYLWFCCFRFLSHLFVIFIQKSYCYF